MPSTSPPSGDPVGDLQRRADALERSAARPQSGFATGSRAADGAYKIVADLLGGVFVGLALGFGLGWLTGGRTRPWDLIAGVLLGFAVSIWMAKRTADRLQAQAAREAQGPLPSVPLDDEDEDEKD